MPSSNTHNQTVNREVLESVKRLRKSGHVVTMTLILRDLPEDLKAKERDVDRALQALRRSGELKHVRKVNENTGKVRKDHGWMVA